MVKCSTTSAASQASRLEIKTQLQQLKVAAEHGAGLSPWEASALADIVDETFFQSSEAVSYRSGQMKYSCVRSTEPAGKPLEQCEMVAVRLTLLDGEDRRELPAEACQRSTDMRRRRLLRICEEAREQGGLLSQEDLGEILMCDVRTVRRDVAGLRRAGVVVPTRGTVKDIGPGVTHKAIAIRLWLEGREPTEVALRIQQNCSMKKSDVKAVLDELIEVMTQELQNSHVVKLDGLGSFRMGLNSTGTVTVREFNASKNITGTKINFLPFRTRDANTKAYTSPMTSAWHIQEAPKNTVLPEPNEDEGEGDEPQEPQEP